MAFLFVHIGAQKYPCVHPFQKWPLRASVFKSLKTNIWIRTFEILVFKTGFLPVSNPCLWGGVQPTGTISHATWTLTVSAVGAMLCCKTQVVKVKVRVQTLVFSHMKTDACKGYFWNGCTQGSFWALMRATRKVVWTDARNGLLGNRCAQGMGQIPNARNIHPGCMQFIKSVGRKEHGKREREKNRTVG